MNLHGIKLPRTWTGIEWKRDLNKSITRFLHRPTSIQSVTAEINEIQSNTIFLGFPSPREPKSVELSFQYALGVGA